MLIFGYNKIMVASRELKNLEVDSRGRITLPKSLREGIEFFAIKPDDNGVIHLYPQRQVSLEDAKLIESLKKSAAEYHSNNLRKMPAEWLE
jgi:bifunctional DNA-binding transcriptional regulator/antitoxin component of YhaV-PrlF toxin-antitoxin module